MNDWQAEICNNRCSVYFLFILSIEKCTFYITVLTTKVPNYVTFFMKIRMLVTYGLKVAFCGLFKRLKCLGISCKL